MEIRGTNLPVNDGVRMIVRLLKQETKSDLTVIRRILGFIIYREEYVQTDLVCISLMQGIQAHLNALEARLRLLPEPDSVTKEAPPE